MADEKGQKGKKNPDPKKDEGWMKKLLSMWGFDLNDMWIILNDVITPKLADFVVARIPDQFLNQAEKMSGVIGNALIGVVIPNSIPGRQYIDDFRSRLVSTINHRIKARKSGNPVVEESVPMSRTAERVAEFLGIDFGRLRAIEGGEWWELFGFYQYLEEIGRSDLLETYSRFLRSNIMHPVRPETAVDDKEGKGTRRRAETSAESGIEVIRSFVASTPHQRLATIELIAQLEQGRNGRATQLNAPLPWLDLVLELDNERRATVIDWMDGLGKHAVFMRDYVRQMPSARDQRAFLVLSEDQREKLSGLAARRREAEKTEAEQRRKQQEQDEDIERARASIADQRARMRQFRSGLQQRREKSRLRVRLGNVFNFVWPWSK